MPRVDWEHVVHALASREPARVQEPVASRAAVAVILRDTPPGFEVFFIRRADHEGDPWSGQMSFPGGRTEAGEGLAAAAVREARAMARMRPMDLSIRVFVFRLREPVETVLSEEVRSLHWVSLDKALAPEA